MRVRLFCCVFFIIIIIYIERGEALFWSSDSFSIGLPRILNWLRFSWKSGYGFADTTCSEMLWLFSAEKFQLAEDSFRKLHVDKKLIAELLKGVW